MFRKVPQVPRGRPDAKIRNHAVEVCCVFFHRPKRECK